MYLHATNSGVLHIWRFAHELVGLGMLAPFGLTTKEISTVATASNAELHRWSLQATPLVQPRPSLLRALHDNREAEIDGHIADEKNVDYVVRQLAEMGTPFLAHVVGECKDEPNLKQIFSKSSPYSGLITEYVERCHGYEGFFTKGNVAALTEAAGADERYEHGHVFD